MRGAVSLAAALGIPLHTDAGAPFPERDLIIFLTFAVILATLVVQGLRMPVVIRALGLEDDASRARADARRGSTRPRRRWPGSTSWWRRTGCATTPPSGCAGSIASAATGSPSATPATATGRSRSVRPRTSSCYDELLEAERRAVSELRRTGAIGDDAMRAVHRELDLEEARLDS